MAIQSANEWLKQNKKKDNGSGSGSRIQTADEWLSQKSNTPTNTWDSIFSERPQTEDDKFLSNWFDRANMLTNKVNDYHKSLGNGYTTDVYGGTSEGFKYLMDDYERARSIAEGRGVNIGSYYDKLQEMQSNLGKYGDFMSSFKTDTAYNNFLRAQNGWNKPDTDKMDAESVAARQGYYAQNQAEISDIDQQMAGLRGSARSPYAAGTGSTPAAVGYGAMQQGIQGAEQVKNVTGNKEVDDQLWQLARRKAGLQQENRQYERFQKPMDDTRDIVNSEGFKDVDRSFKGAGDSLGAFLYATDQDKTNAVSYQSAFTPGQIAPVLSGEEAQKSQAILKGQQNAWDMLTEDEVGIYYSIQKDKGQVDADKWLDGMTTTLQRRADAQMQQQVAEGTREGYITTNLASSVMNLAGGISAAGSDIVNTALGRDVNPYDNAHKLQRAASAIRGTTAQDIETAIDKDFMDEIEAGNRGHSLLAQFASNSYQAIMSGVDSALGGYTMGTGYTAAMSLGAASQRAAELYEQGASREQIVMGAIGSGALEALTEKYSIENFVGKFIEKPPKSFGQWIKRTATQGLVEASEEVASEIGNMVWDALVFGSGSENQQLIRQLMEENGMTEDEARVEAMKQAAMDVFWAAYGGFVSGGGMGGIGGAGSLVSNAVDTHRAGRAVQRAGTQAQLVEQARATDEYKKGKGFQNLTERVNDSLKKSKPSFADTQRTGKLFQKLLNNDMENLSKAERETVRDAIYSDLQKRGIQDTNLTITNTLAKEAFGEELTKSEQKLFDSFKGKEIIESIAQSDEFKERMREDTKEARERVMDTYGAASSQSADVVSSEGKTLINNDDGSTTEAQIDSIESVKDGKLQLKMADGTIVDASKISYSTKGEANLYATLARMNANAQQLNALANTEIKNSNALTRYSAALKEMYDYGRIGVPMEGIRNPVFASALTDAQRKMVYDMGKAVYDSQDRTAKKTTYRKGEGKVVFTGDEKKLTKLQKTSLAGLRAVSKALGVNIEVFESQVDENGNHIGENGSYDPSTGTIRIDLYAGQDGKGTMLFTAAHELTHFMKDWSPEKFKTFSDFLMKNYAESGASIDEMVQTQIEKAKRNGRTIDADVAMEEVIADSCEKMLADGKAIQKLQELRSKDATLANKIVRYLKDLAAKISKVYSGLDPDSREGKYVAQMNDAADELSRLWTEGLAAAAENYANAELDTEAQTGDSAYSLRGINKDGIEVYVTSKETLSMRWKDRKKKYLKYVNDTYRGRTAKFTRNGHTYYAEMDVKNATKPIYGEKGSDPLGRDALINTGADGDVFELIENSRYDSSKIDTKNHKARDGFTDYFDYFVKTVQIDDHVFDLKADVKKQYKSKHGYTYTLTLVENKTASPSPIQGVKPLNNSGNELVANGMVAQKSNGVKNSLRSDAEINDASGVAVDKESTNGKLLSDRDSEGKELTEGQKDYFKDSKIRDKNGNLQVMYRGDNGNYTVFDRKKSNHANLYGRGFYFTNSKSHASTYGNAKPYYLNITHPLSYGQNSITKHQMRKFIQAIAANEDDYGIENYGYGATVDSVLKSVWGKGDFEMIWDLNQTAIGDMVDAVELFNDVNGTNYDGLVMPTETVTFQSEQAKNTDNEAPTADPDVRFSDRDSYFSQRKAVGADAVHKAEIAVLKANAAQDLEAQKRDMQSQIDKLKSDFKNEKASMEALHEAEMAVEKAASRQELRSVISEYNQQLKEIQEQRKADAAAHKAEIRELQKKWDEEAEAIQKSMQYDAEQEINRLTESYANSRKAAVENRRRTEIRNSIQAIGDKLSKMILNPGKTDARHVPVTIAKQVAAFCNIFLESEQHALQMAENNLTGREKAMEFANDSRGITKGRQLEAEIIQRQRDRNARKNEALNNLRAQYEALTKDPVLTMYHDDHVQLLLDELSKELAGKDIYDMTEAELRQVQNTMQSMYYTITNANKVLSMGKNKTLIGVVEKMGKEIDQNTVRHNSVAVMARRYLQWQMSPDTFFNSICGYIKNNEGKAVQRMFEQGSVRMFTVQRDFYMAFKHLTESNDKATRKYIKQLMSNPTKEMVSWGLTDANGKPVKTSKGMMLQAYMLFMQEDSFQSLIYGGFKLPNASKYYDGKIAESYGDADESSLLSAGIGEEYSSMIHQIQELQTELDGENVENADKIQAQIDEIKQNAMNLVEGAEARLIEIRENIRQQLTEADIDLINTARQWYKHTGDLMTEVYVNMYGYKPNLVDGYVPIHRDLTTVKTDIRTPADAFNLENSGFTKDRVRSTAPILLTDIFEELSRQQNQISRYYGFAQVQKDFNRIWNMKAPGSRTSINAKVAAKYGTGKTLFGVSGEQYIEHYIRDVSGANTQEDILSNFYGNAAAATLSLNPRVAVSQLASIPTAAAVVGWKSMTVGLAKGLPTALTANGRERLANDSVWSWQRQRGNGGATELSDLQARRGLYGKVTKSKLGRMMFNWCQAMDVLATSTMWSMAEDRVKSQGIQQGTDEWYEAVDQTYADIIRKSQPNYTVTERSDMLRDKRGGMKLLTMYKTQSNQNLNLLINSTGEFKRMMYDYRHKLNGVTSADVKKATANLANAYTGVVIGGTVAFVALRTAVNFLMGNIKAYRDDDTDEITEDAVKEAMFKEILSSMSGMFALGGQVYDFVYAAVSHEKYYGISDSAISHISSMLDSMEQLISYATDESKKKNANYQEQLNKKLLANLKASLTFIGIPANNIQKIMSATDMWYKKLHDNVPLYESGETTAKQYETQFLNAFRDGDKEKMGNVVAKMTAEADGWSDARNEKEIISKMKNFLKGKYLDGEITENDVKQIMGNFFEVSADSYMADLRKWNGIKETGMTDSEYKDAYFDKEVTSKQWIDYQVKYMGKSRDSATTSELHMRCERDEGVIYNDLKDLYIEGKVSFNQAVNIRVKYGGDTKDKALAYVEKWQWQKEIPYFDTDMGWQTIDKYNDYCKTQNVDKTVFYSLWNWRRIKGNGTKAKLIDYIAGLNLSDSQKAALYKSFSQSNWKPVYKYPWTKW